MSQIFGNPSNQMILPAKSVQDTSNGALVFTNLNDKALFIPKYAPNHIAMSFNAVTGKMECRGITPSQKTWSTNSLAGVICRFRLFPDENEDLEISTVWKNLGIVTAPDTLLEAYIGMAYSYTFNGPWYMVGYGPSQGGASTYFSVYRTAANFSTILGGGGTTGNLGNASVQYAQRFKWGRPAGNNQYSALNIDYALDGGAWVVQPGPGGLPGATGFLGALGIPWLFLGYYTPQKVGANFGGVLDSFTITKGRIALM